MSRGVAVFVVASALFALACAAPWAQVRIQPSLSAGGAAIDGWVDFESNSTHTWVTANVNMTSMYADRDLGIHIHQFGDLVTGASETLFEPGNKTFATHWQGNGTTVFGCPETNTFPNYRAGCLGNWRVETNGVISQTKVFPIDQFAPTPSYAQGLINSPIGLGMIIHAAVDPCNGTSTLYGARLAGGVIGSKGTNVAAAYTAGKTTLTATCRFTGTTFGGNSGIRGSVWLRQTSTGAISIRANITGIALGANDTPRSMHIHDIGDLSDLVNGTKTGGHWNPTGSNHSIPNDTPRHAGDLGRISVSFNGNLWYDYTLSSSGTPNYHPLLSDPTSVLGRGMILHAGRDEGCAAPTSNGNAGSRVAQCVIGLARDEVWDELVARWPQLPQMPAQIGNLACSAPVAAPVAQPVNNGAPTKPSTPVRAAAGIVVPSVFGFLLAIVALLF